MSRGGTRNPVTANPRHTAGGTKRTTTQAGLGWEHRRTRGRLLARHQDGTPCPCRVGAECGPSCPCRRAGYALPMYRDPTRNVDGRPLQADHSIARSQGGTKADRLMLATCNASRGNGTRAHTHTGTHTGSGYREPWWTRDWLGGMGAP